MCSCTVVDDWNNWGGGGSLYVCQYTVIGESLYPRIIILTGSHCILGYSDRESFCTGVTQSYDTGRPGAVRCGICAYNAYVHVRARRV